MALKHRLIDVFEKNKGKEISGQELACRFGVTRAAVWKAVASLKNDGYPITATRNKGYMLHNNSNVLSAEGIRQHMDNEISHWHITVLETVDSTNTYAKTMLNDLNGLPALIAANEQTAGRGRRGHSFFSPKSSGIYMSIILQPDLSPVTLITAAAAVAVCLACNEITGSRPLIKWVNDVYLGNKKICGILTEGIISMETRTVDTAVIGIGVNVTTQEFPDSIPYAGSLKADGLSRNMLTGRICSHLNRLLTEGSESIIKEYRSRQMVIGKEISYQLNGETRKGVAMDVNDTGNLIVETDKGKDVLTAGEISINKDFLNSPLS